MPESGRERLCQRNCEEVSKSCLYIRTVSIRVNAIFSFVLIKNHYYGVTKDKSNESVGTFR